MGQFAGWCGKVCWGCLVRGLELGDEERGKKKEEENLRETPKKLPKI